MNWHLLHTEKAEGFDIKCETAPEQLDPAECFTDSDTIEAIRAGRYEWFIAKVTASKNGIDLASEYLGGCCHYSLSDFLEGLYFEDMKTDAIREAKKAIEGLKV